MASHNTRTRGLSRTTCPDNMSFSGVYSSSTDAIKYILRNVSADDMHDRLSQALNAAPIPSFSPVQIDALLSIFKAVGFPAAAIAEEAVTVASQNTRHCVRCHQSYLEKDNGQRACCIYHSNTLQAQPGPHAGFPVAYVYGRHTSQVQSVAHAPAPPIDFLDANQMFSESSTATTRSSTPVGPVLSFQDEEYISHPQRQSSISTDVSSSDMSTDMSSNSFLTEMSLSDISVYAFVEESGMD
ncbi:hypothetical protein MSAN_00368600 [Mycena sanguinolenta]|uniref:Uncharacterized protein n=1 Tax=Mycena sanguinolenta TaxID=230812 RepID=A0A8H6ZCE5_9AGAR|nr:hypothetical protein MSAN_00368600 [Mycena sanguinolenta]